MNPTFKQVTKTRYVELVAELAQEIFVPALYQADAEGRRPHWPIIPERHPDR